MNDVPPAPEVLLALLRALRTGEPASMPDLESVTGIATTEIEAAMPLLVDHGVRRRRDGRLRIPGGVELLDGAAISAGLATGLERPPEVDVLGVVGSSNDVAKAQLEGGRPAPRVVLAEAQTAGRGRRGRGWASPVAANVYMSLVEPLPAGLDGARGLSLLAGAAAADAIEARTGVPVALKWPNDLLVDGRKLGGILVELTVSGGRCHAVIGIGINVRVPAYVAREIDQAWVDLAGVSGAPVARNELVVALIRQLAEDLPAFHAAGLTPTLRARWQSRDAFLDQWVVARSEAGEIRGRERGIDAAGELLIETGEGLSRVGAGEVTLRLEQSG